MKVMEGVLELEGDGVVFHGKSSGLTTWTLAQLARATTSLPHHIRAIDVVMNLRFSLLLYVV